MKYLAQCLAHQRIKGGMFITDRRVGKKQVEWKAQKSSQSLASLRGAKHQEMLKDYQGPSHSQGPGCLPTAVRPSWRLLRVLHYLSNLGSFRTQGKKVLI